MSLGVSYSQFKFQHNPLVEASVIQFQINTTHCCVTDQIGSILINHGFGISFLIVLLCGLLVFLKTNNNWSPSSGIGVNHASILNKEDCECVW